MKKQNKMLTLAAVTSAAFKAFTKGEQFVYCVECQHNATGIIGDGKPAVKIGYTTNLYERFRSYLSLTTQVAALVVPVKDGAKAERILHAAMKEYSLGQEVFDLRAVEAFKRITAEL